MLCESGGEDDVLPDPWSLPGVPSISTCGQEATFTFDDPFLKKVVMSPETKAHVFEDWIHLALVTAVRTGGYNKI
jgi:hypothetical protein